MLHRPPRSESGPRPQEGGEGGSRARMGRDMPLMDGPGPPQPPSYHVIAILEPVCGRGCPGEGRGWKGTLSFTSVGIHARNTIRSDSWDYADDKKTQTYTPIQR